MRAKGEAGLRSKEGGGVELQGEGPAFVSSRERTLNPSHPFLWSAGLHKSRAGSSSLSSEASLS